MSKSKAVVTIATGHDEWCDDCGRVFTPGESIYRIGDRNDPDTTYLCIDRSKCVAAQLIPNIKEAA